MPHLEASRAGSREVDDVVASANGTASIGDGVNASHDSSRDAGYHSGAKGSNTLECIQSAAFESGDVNALLHRDGGSRGESDKGGEKNGGGELHDGD